MVKEGLRRDGSGNGRVNLERERVEFYLDKRRITQLSDLVVGTYLVYQTRREAPEIVLFPS
jgi:hypothetical protein